MKNGCMLTEHVNSFHGLYYVNLFSFAVHPILSRLKDQGNPVLNKKKLYLPVKLFLSLLPSWNYLIRKMMARARELNSDFYMKTYRDHPSCNVKTKCQTRNLEYSPLINKI